MRRYRVSWVTMAAVGAAVLAWCAIGAAGGDLADLSIPRREPVRVPGGASFSGSPSYVSEFASKLRDNGGPLSDFGSHCGIKAGVDGLSIATMLHDACVTGQRVFDYSRTGLAGISSLSFEVGGSALGPAGARRVSFEPLSWQETASVGGLEVTARAAFVDTDVYVLWIDVRNATDRGLDLTPTLLYEGRADRGQWQLDATRGLVVEGYQVRTIAGAIGALFGGRLPQPYQDDGFQIDAHLPTNWLAVAPAPSFGVKDVTPSTGQGSFRLRGSPVHLDAGKGMKTFIAFAYSPDSQDAAATKAQSSRDRLGTLADLGQDELKTRTAHFLAQLPRAHTHDPRYEDLFRTAAAALQMALYAPRNRMTTWGCVPTKVHYNWFWLWDSAFQALGYSATDPGLAEQVMLTIADSQGSDGCIAHMTSDALTPLTCHTQSPVLGFVAQRIIDRDPDRGRALAFEKRMYAVGRRYVDWWETHRDRDGDGLLELLSQDESGWDNSPRRSFAPPEIAIPYVGTVGEIVASRVMPLDGVDLNSWMYLYDQAMARWASDLGEDAARAGFQTRAQTLATHIDQILWSPARGCWFDAYRPPGAKVHRHVEVLTPAIWFPAFAGATRDLSKVRQVIEGHLLAPQEFFGPYPIPSVAYNDPHFSPQTPGWRGDIWLVTTEVALETLFKYGYESQAEDLAERTLSMMADQGGMHGVWETYDPTTGNYRDPDSNGSYASFQFGWSAAFTMEILLHRYQEERFVFDDTTRIAGWIRRARAWPDGPMLYEARVAPQVPHMELSSADGLPLAQSRRLRIRLDDPYGALAAGPIQVIIAGQPHSLAIGQDTQVLIDRP